MQIRHAIARAVLVGGTATALLDGLDAIVAYRLVLGLDPVTIYQFVASGLLGPAAFQAGSAALLGLAVHCAIAYAAAAAFTLAASRLPQLLERPALHGALFGVGVYAFMTYLVIPLSRIAPSPFSLPLFVNGVLGHALFVGLPIALAARRYLAAAWGQPAPHPRGATEAT